MPLNVDGLTFAYGDRVVFDDYSCAFAEGEVTGVVGPSGSGKSTLLAVVVGAETPRRGSVGYPPSLLDGGRLQRHRIAWMAQTANLMLRRSALDNVTLPLRGVGADRQVAADLGTAALQNMGLGEVAGRRCAELSGGERQRVAMARALAAGTPLLIADEPTSSLDRTNRALLLEGLRVVAAAGAIVIVATHDPEVVAACDTVVDLVAASPDAPIGVGPDGS